MKTFPERDHQILKMPLLQSPSTISFKYFVLARIRHELKANTP